MAPIGKRGRDDTEPYGAAAESISTKGRRGEFSALNLPTSMGGPTTGHSAPAATTAITPVGRLLNELPPSMVPLEKAIRGILFLLTDITCPLAEPVDGRQLTRRDVPPMIRQVLSRAKVITDMYCVLADRNECISEVYGSGRTGLVSAYSSDVDFVVRELQHAEMLRLEELGSQETPRHLRASPATQQQTQQQQRGAPRGGGDISDYGITRLEHDADHLQGILHAVKLLAAGSQHPNRDPSKPEVSPVFLAGSPLSCAQESADGTKFHAESTPFATAFTAAQARIGNLRQAAWRLRGISNMFGVSPFHTENQLHEEPTPEPRGGVNNDWGDKDPNGVIGLGDLSDADDIDILELEDRPPTSDDDDDGTIGAPVQPRGKSSASSKIPLHRRVGMEMNSTVSKSIITVPLIPANLSLGGGYSHNRIKEEILRFDRIARGLKAQELPSAWLTVETATITRSDSPKVSQHHNRHPPVAGSLDDIPQIRLVVTNPNSKRNQPRHLRNAFGSVQKILHAKIPIAKMTHNAEEIPIDISFCRDGASTSDYIIKKIATADSVWCSIDTHTRELMFVNSCLDEDLKSSGNRKSATSMDSERTRKIMHYRENLNHKLEQLSQNNSLLLAATRGLVIVLKHLLHSQGLNDPSVGGLGSFPLTLMVLWFLEEVAPSLPRNLQGSYGALLVKFLGYYGDVSGEGFNARRYGICVASRTIFQKPPTDELVIKNPLDGSQNAARACSRFFTSVQPLFARWFNMLLPTPTAATTSRPTTELEAQMRRSLSPTLHPVKGVSTAVDQYGRPFSLLDELSPSSHKQPPPELPKCVREIEKLFADVIVLSAAPAALPPGTDAYEEGSHHQQQGSNHTGHASKVGRNTGISVYYRVLSRLGELQEADARRTAELARNPQRRALSLPLLPYEALAPAVFDWLPRSQIFIMSGVGGLWL